METIYNYLDNLNIKYKKFNHQAIFTVRDAEKIDQNIPGIKTKNLFLRDKKKISYFLVLTEARKRIDLKKLARQLEVKKISFADSEDLNKFLNLKPGSVSPFGLIYDKDRKVKVIIDKEILKNNTINFHPNNNTATLNLKTKNFKEFLKSLKNKIIYLDLL